MPPADLGFVAPRTLSDALDEVARDGAVALGGGTSLASLLKNRLIDVDRLVYLARVPELRGIGRDDGEIRLGATTTLRELSRSALVNAAIPALAGAAGQVGNPRVRSVATVGGAVVHADPRQDLPPVLIALDARVRIVGPAGTREVPMSEFFLGFMETAVGEDELLTEIVVSYEPSCRAAYCRFTPGSADDYPTVGVAAAVWCAEDSTVRRARIALGSVGSTPVFAELAGRALEGGPLTDDAIERAAAEAVSVTAPAGDQRGSADYKRRMAEVWTRRALRAVAASLP